MNQSRAKTIRRWCFDHWTPEMKELYTGRDSRCASASPFKRFCRAMRRYWREHKRLPE